MNKFIIAVPFTGLGLYAGYRGARWLRSRITIFKQFVIPSLLNQTDRDFVLWVQWRPEEKTNPQVIALAKYLSEIPNFKFVFTYEGICIYDDKFEDSIAKKKLFDSLYRSLPYLFDYLPDCENIIHLLQPSDDLYSKNTVKNLKKAFIVNNKAEAISYIKGYICNYKTKELSEYNPNTNPPFSAIKFPRDVFFDPSKFMAYTSLKSDVGKYKKGTPQPSHEYLSHCLETYFFEERGFLVGCHTENISTYYNHPFKGEQVGSELLDNFGIMDVPYLALPTSFRKWFMRKLPYKWQRKLRYLIGEKLVSKIYEYLRQ
jgi:hypothetical protein